MGKWIKKLLGLSAVGLVLGMICLAIGVFSGGIEDFERIYHPLKGEFKLEVLEFGDIDNLEIDVSNQNLLVREGDTNKLTVSFIDHPDFKVDVSQDNSQLSIRDASHSSNTEGKIIQTDFFRIYTHLLAGDPVEEDFMVQVTLPKGASLDAIKGQLLDSHLILEGQSLSSLDLKLHGSHLELKTGQVSDLSLNLLDSSFYMNQLQTDTIKLTSLGEGDLMIEDSRIKQLVADIKDGQLMLSRGQLSEGMITIEGVGLGLLDLLYSGSVTVSAKDTPITLHDKDRFKEVSLDLEVLDGQIYSEEVLRKTGSEEGDREKLRHEGEVSTGKVIVRLQGQDILLTDIIERSE